MSQITNLPFYNLCPYAVSTMVDMADSRVADFTVAPTSKPVQVLSISVPAILGQRGIDIPFSTLRITHVLNLPAPTIGRLLIVPKMVQIILKDLGRTLDIVSSHTSRHIGNEWPSLVTEFDESGISADEVPPLEDDVPAKASEVTSEEESKLGAEAVKTSASTEKELKSKAEEGEAAGEGEAPRFVNLTGEEFEIGEGDCREPRAGLSKGTKVATVIEDTDPYVKKIKHESIKAIRTCYRTVYVENLPAPVAGRFLVVSERIFRMFPDRKDLVFPDPNSATTAFDGTRVYRSLINKIEYSDEARADVLRIDKVKPSVYAQYFSNVSIPYFVKGLVAGAAAMVAWKAIAK